jgi:hypothetical protein
MVILVPARWSLRFLVLWDGAVPLTIPEMTCLSVRHRSGGLAAPGAGRWGNWRRSYQARSRWYRLTRESALVS